MVLQVMLRTLPKKMPKAIYPCKGPYNICICMEYLDFTKEKDRNTYKNCFLTYMKEDITQFKESRTN